ncbi:uncharacterized protein LOC106643851 [Copidosoma floridanum]|uniref:uncharacterized protein LOC106643851 n=1 Tax=Copidosoma floridanum TaxID=29053 RepID=UPI0006C9AB36|nr:uncharacterized protein LOC106643851 [Copidosoma floridanum]
MALIPQEKADAQAALRKAIEELSKELANPPKIAGFDVMDEYSAEIVDELTKKKVRKLEIDENMPKLQLDLLYVKKRRTGLAKYANEPKQSFRSRNGPRQQGGRSPKPSSPKANRRRGIAAMADGRPSRTLGFVTLPFQLGGVKRDVDVIVLLALDADCYVGANFINAFGTIHYPVDRVLVLKGPGTKVPLEVVGMTATSEREAPLGCTTWVEHEIKVTTSRPIKHNGYPVSDKIQEVIHGHISEMLESGVIKRSNSGWASPMVMIRKKDGKYRFCVDYQKKNAVIIPDAYPLSHMDTILRKLRKARFISTLDLSSTYHQIPVAKKWLIESVIGPKLEPYAYAYLNNIVIVTETFEEHLKWLEYVLKRVLKAGLIFNRGKSEFCQPENLKQLRWFLGMVSWYRKFLPNYSTVVELINRLLRKDQPFNWKDEQQRSFEQTKALLTFLVVLQRPDPKSPTRFKVVTNHSSLQWLVSIEDPTRRLSRWAMELQSHCFEIEQWKGSQNCVPDALSRLYQDDESGAVAAFMWEPPAKDPWYQEIVQKVRDDLRDQLQWKTVGEYLYKYRPDSTVDEALDDIEAWKLVVPKSQHDQVLQECHDTPSASHLGREKTFARVFQLYYWPGY